MISGGTSYDTIVFGNGLSRDQAIYELKDDNLTIKFEGLDDEVIVMDGLWSRLLEYNLLMVQPLPA